MSTMHIVADTEINKYLRAFETRGEAIDYVRRLLATNGEDYARDLAIGRQTADGDLVDIVAGDDLLACVRDAPKRKELVPVGLYGSGSGYSGSEAMTAKPSGC